MRVAILYDAGSEDWSPQDVAAVLGNVHEVRDVRRIGHRTLATAPRQREVHAERVLGTQSRERECGLGGGHARHDRRARQEAGVEALDRRGDGVAGRAEVVGVHDDAHDQTGASARTPSASRRRASSDRSRCRSRR